MRFASDGAARGRHVRSGRGAAFARALGRGCRCLPVHHAEAEIRALSKPIGHADPEHRQGFEIASLRERPGIDRLEAELGHQAGHHLFGVGVVAAQ